MPNRDIANRMIFVQHLKEELFKKLSGDNVDRCWDIFDTNPEERFYIGQLYPIQAASERYATIHQISVDFIINENELPAAKLKIFPLGNLFFRVFPTLEEQRKTVETGLGRLASEKELKWRRDENNNYILPIASVYEPLKLDERFLFEVCLADIPEIDTGYGQITIDEEFDARLDACIEEIYSRPDIYRIVRNPVEMDYLKDKDTFADFLYKQTDSLPVKPVWSLAIKITAKKIEKGRLKISVSLANHTRVSEFDISVDRSKKNSKNLKSYSNRLFNANLKIEVDGADIKSVSLNYFNDDYKYRGFQKAVGHNCSIIESSDNTIQTTHTPCFIQKRLKTRDDLAVSFSDLVDDPVKILSGIATALHSEYIAWTEDFQRREYGITSINSRTQYLTELENTKKEIERFEYGISMIKKYDIVKTAFVLMNQSFIGSSKGYNSWRLFQIVFMVSLLPDIIVQEYGKEEIVNNNLACADVLYFPTGGGKTEAFLAVVVFNLFFDRLRGKAAGVSAILKYPLRLLSAQQVSRVCDVLASAEMLRKKLPNIAAMSPFSLGYFAGEANTPNSLSEVLMDEIESLPQAEINTKYRLLDTCPYCHCPINVMLNRKNIRLEHICSNEACPSGGRVPLYIVDREVYRYLPSVIISTLDKMSAIGYQSNFRNILGKVKRNCPIHGFTSKNVCTESKLCNIDVSYHKNVTLYDSAPGLIICDEMHLSREALGTFAAHYESAFQYMVNQFSNNKFSNKQIKYIGASATVSGFEEQMYHLFGKASILFPTQSPYLEKNLYSYIDESEDNRTIIGFMPYGKASLNALAYSLRYMREILSKYRDNPQLIRQLKCIELDSEKEALLLLQDYWMILNYNNRKLDCNLVTGALDDPINIELSMLGLPGYEARKITGDDSFGSVKSLIQTIEGAPDMFDLFNIIVSTSMISHGVDSSRLNNMIFFGTPSSTSEYIQAYSRTGRVYPSFVINIMRTKNEKDISNLKHFESFHKYKNLMIDVVPIDRWADKAIVKTFPGILSAFILNYYDYDLQTRYGNIFMMDALQKAIRDGVIVKEEILEHMLMSYGCIDENGNTPMVAKRFYDYITQHIEMFWEIVNGEQFERIYITQEFERIGFPVMNSLRDTDENLTVVLE